MQMPDYQPALDAPPLADDELAALDALLAALPGDAAMNIEMLDGYLTALLLAPTPVHRRPATDWMPPVWGGGDPFTSGKQRKHAVVQVLRHLHAIDLALRGDAQGWEPVFSVAETDDGDEFADAEDWCIGFLHAVAQEAEAWGERFDDSRLGPLLVPLALLGGDEAGLPAAELDRLADPQQRDELSRAVPEAVLALAAGRG